MKKRFLVILTPLVFTAFVGVQAQDEGAADPAEEEGRVQYALILPEEKNAEMVKAEENNPFETAAEGRGNSDGDTEENQVRDLLMRMPIGGAVSGLHGMRAMLGGMRLEAGMDVPPVIPDQQVVLRVKGISSSAIELVWVEKKPTGLPPKLLVIPMDGSPTVRYRMPAGSSDPSQKGGGGGGSMGTLRRPDVSAFSPARAVQDAGMASAGGGEPPSGGAAGRGMPATRAGQSPEAASPPAPSPAAVPEASVLRMLFGNHSPEAK